MFSREQLWIQGWDGVSQGRGHAGEKKLWTECHLGPPEVEAREEGDQIVAARGGTPGGRG